MFSLSIENFYLLQDEQHSDEKMLCMAYMLVHRNLCRLTRLHKQGIDLVLDELVVP